MGRDVIELSRNAKKIFENLKPYFPPDSFGNMSWKPEGIVHSNIWHDLRSAAGRQKLARQIKDAISYDAEIQASIYKDTHKCESRGELNWLEGFTLAHFTKGMQHNLELLLILNDLDFQIETMDFAEDDFEGD